LRVVKQFYNYFLSKDRNFVRELTDILGFVPGDLCLYRLAFSHKSYTHKIKTLSTRSTRNNERLEYLGDAVLGTIVADYLFKKYPQKDEGFLTKMRSKIVKRKSLNAIADQMNLDVFLRSYGVEAVSNSMLGNALEAFIGAIYLDCGHEGTRRFIVTRMLKRYLNVRNLETFDDNYKSQLLEWCQKREMTITYKVLSKFKFDNRDRFKVCVLVNNENLAIAEDFSKKSAEQLASKDALSQLLLTTTVAE